MILELCMRKTQRLFSESIFGEDFGLRLQITIADAF